MRTEPELIAHHDMGDETRKDNKITYAKEQRHDREGRRIIRHRDSSTISRRKREEHKRFIGTQIIRRETADRWEKEKRPSSKHRVVVSR